MWTKLCREWSPVQTLRILQHFVMCGSSLVSASSTVSSLCKSMPAFFLLPMQIGASRWRCSENCCVSVFCARTCGLSAHASQLLIYELLWCRQTSCQMELGSANWLPRKYFCILVISKPAWFHITDLFQQRPAVARDGSSLFQGPMPEKASTCF